MRSKSFSRSPFFDAARSVDPRTLLSLVFHLPSFIRLFCRLMGDPRVPYHLKLLVYGSFLYCLSPIDLVRDFLMLGLGYVDDALLIFFALRKLVRDSPPEVVREHVEAISGYRRDSEKTGRASAASQQDDWERGGHRVMKNVTPHVRDEEPRDGSV